jgi:hypothetical protein
MPAMRNDQETLDLFRLYLDEIGRHPLYRDALAALRSPEIRVRLQGFSGAA